MCLCYKSIKLICKQFAMLKLKVSSKRTAAIALRISAKAMWRRVCIFIRGDFAQTFHPMTI